MKNFRFVNFYKSIDNVRFAISHINKARYGIIGSTYDAKMSEEEKKEVNRTLHRLEEIEEELKIIEASLVRLPEEL